MPDPLIATAEQAAEWGHYAHAYEFLHVNNIASKDKPFTLTVPLPEGITPVRKQKRGRDGWSYMKGKHVYWWESAKDVAAAIEAGLRQHEGGPVELKVKRLSLIVGVSHASPYTFVATATLVRASGVRLETEAEAVGCHEVHYGKGDGVAFVGPDPKPIERRWLVTIEIRPRKEKA